MRVRYSQQAFETIQFLMKYLVEEIKMPSTAIKYIFRMRAFGDSLATNSNTYPLCRHKQWATQGLKCATFDKKWVFAFKAQKNGLLVIHHIKLGKLIRNTK